MKRNLLLFLILSLFATSCKSPEDKALTLVNKYMKSVLYDYDSYEATSIQVDSAYTALGLMEQPRTFANAIAKIEPQLEQAKTSLKRAKSELSLWSNAPYDFGREQYNQAKEEVAEYKKAIADYEKQIEDAKNGIKNYAQTFQQTYIGWLAVVRYRCNTRGGDPSFGEGLFIIDPSLKEIIFAIPDFDESEEKLWEIINKYSVE